MMLYIPVYYTTVFHIRRRLFISVGAYRIYKIRASVPIFFRVRFRAVAAPGLPSQRMVFIDAASSSAPRSSLQPRAGSASALGQRRPPHSDVQKLHLRPSSSAHTWMGPIPLRTQAGLASSSYGRLPNQSKALTSATSSPTTLAPRRGQASGHMRAVPLPAEASGASWSQFVVPGLNGNPARRGSLSRGQTEQRGRLDGGSGGDSGGGSGGVGRAAKLGLRRCRGANATAAIDRLLSAQPRGTEGDASDDVEDDAPVSVVATAGDDGPSYEARHGPTSSFRLAELWRTLPPAEPPAEPPAATKASNGRGCSCGQVPLGGSGGAGGAGGASGAGGPSGAGGAGECGGHIKGEARARLPDSHELRWPDSRSHDYWPPDGIRVYAPAWWKRMPTEVVQATDTFDSTFRERCAGAMEAEYTQRCHQFSPRDGATPLASPLGTSSKPASHTLLDAPWALVQEASAADALPTPAAAAPVTFCRLSSACTGVAFGRELVRLRHTKYGCCSERACRAHRLGGNLP